MIGGNLTEDRGVYEEETLPPPPLQHLVIIESLRLSLGRGHTIDHSPGGKIVKFRPPPPLTDTWIRP